MLALGLCVALFAQGDAITGQVKITRGAIGKSALVSLMTDGGPIRIVGDLTKEISKLASAKLEVHGVRDGDRLAVKAYTILEVSGVKPVVGYLVQMKNRFSLKDGDGIDIPLSLSPRSRQRLTDQAGAKLWVHGRNLVSGEMKVLKYGILRAPPTAQKEE